MCGANIKPAWENPTEHQWTEPSCMRSMSDLTNAPVEELAQIPITTLQNQVKIIHPCQGE